VTLSWDFSYKDSASIRNGPWEARDVLEISFGIWKSIDDRLLLKKIVTVDNSGKFEVRSGYESKMNCSHSINKLAFKLKGFSFEDQATYGINVEFGRLDQNPLTDSTRVSIGASYSGQDENFNMRNETAYVSDTFDLLYKRSVQDRNESFSAYRIQKGNITIIALGKEQENKNGSCVIDSALLEECKQRFALRYYNKTYVAFRIKNVTLHDAGRYLLEAFFLGMIDPEYADIKLSVQEKPVTTTSEPGTTTRFHEISEPKAKGGQSDIQFSATLLLALMMVFQIGWSLINTF